MPPEGPVRIGLQAGHWKSAEVPDYLSDLRSNGTNGGGKAEWEVNLAIAQRTAARLEAMGYVLDGQKQSGGGWVFSYYYRPNRELLLAKK